MSHEAPDDAGALRHLYLIDGSGFVFRAFHALPPLTRADGTPVNAVLGFTTCCGRSCAKPMRTMRSDLRHGAAHLSQ